MPISSESDWRKKTVAYFSKHGLESAAQTRISLFVLAVKQANSMILSKVEYHKMDWTAYSFLHNQYYREVELATLLYRATSWSSDISIYMQMTQFDAKFWQRTQIGKYVWGSMSHDINFFEYLALSHAFMSEIRFVPLFPASWKLDTPFLQTLYDMEVESGHLIQTQIRLLKEMELNLGLNEKEVLVEKKRTEVETLFNDFLRLVFVENE
jgi:hypothetical protein